MDILIKRAISHTKENSSNEFHSKFIEYICETRNVEDFEELKEVFSNIEFYIDMDKEAELIYSFGWSLDELLDNARENCETFAEIIENVKSDTEWTVEQGAVEVLGYLNDFEEINERTVNLGPINLVFS